MVGSDAAPPRRVAQRPFPDSARTNQRRGSSASMAEEITRAASSATHTDLP